MFMNSKKDIIEKMDMNTKYINYLNELILQELPKMVYYDEHNEEKNSLSHCIKQLYIQVNKLIEENQNIRKEYFCSIQDFNQKFLSMNKRIIDIENQLEYHNKFICVKFYMFLVSIYNYIFGYSNEETKPFNTTNEYN